MSEPYIGEVRMFAGNFAPHGWEFCDGRLLSIADHDGLFSLIGTTYGGDGESTFALPDLRGRVPVNQGTAPGGTYAVGDKGGVEAVTLVPEQLAEHNHALVGNTALGSSNRPAGSVPAQTRDGVMLYRQVAPGATLSPQAVSSTGGGERHDNVQPFLCVNFIIALVGLFPSQT